MLQIRANNLSDAWRKSLIKLYSEGKTINDPEILFDDLLVLEIENSMGCRIDVLFPMERGIIEEYNKYIINGGQAGKVLPEHALYHKRIFSFNGINQADFVAERLKQNPFSKRAVVSLWMPEYDDSQKKAPCILLLWFRVENRKLAMHVHMRACDAFRKLLMNLNICSEIMNHISSITGYPAGTYTHIVDSFHIYRRDSEEVEKTIRCIS